MAMLYSVESMARCGSRRTERVEVAEVRTERACRVTRHLDNTAIHNLRLTATTAACSDDNSGSCCPPTTAAEGADPSCLGDWGRAS
jgi:hypothetical protein